MKMLVIGYGNTLRGDDGVGPLVASQVAAWHLPQVNAMDIHQLTPELAAEISQAEVVCFVDAWVPPPGEGQDQCKIERLVPQVTQSLDHDWSPNLLLHLSQTLYGHMPTAYHLLIPATKFDFSETLSPRAIHGMNWAIQTIKSIVNQEATCYA